MLQMTGAVTYRLTAYKPLSSEENTAGAAYIACYRHNIHLLSNIEQSLPRQPESRLRGWDLYPIGQPSYPAHQHRTKTTDDLPQTPNNPRIIKMSSS